MMKLIWFGHACFKLEAADGTVVFDPYERDYLPGLSLPDICADVCISSHEHRDHYAPGAVTLSGRKPTFAVTQISSFHDECGGGKRGYNLISVVETEGMRICHLGDLGHRLSREQLRKIGHIDVLMLPVGGVYTVDAAAAKEIAEDISPRVIIPMHYKGKGRGLQNVAPVDDFLSLYPDDMTLRLPTSEWNMEIPDKQTIIVFPWQ